MSTRTTQDAATARRTPLASHALVALAVAQIVSGGLVSVFADSPIMQADRAGEPAITPQGYAFTIWGVIQIVSLGLALWLAWSRRRATTESVRVVDALTRALLVLFTGFNVWLVASVVEPVWATLAVFLVMGLALVAGLRVAVRARQEIVTWSTLGRFLVWTTLGLYAGWSTVALWLNLTTALAFSGAPVSGTAGVVGQLAVLAGATATAVVVLRRTGGLVAYAAAVVWALVAAVLGAAAAGEPLLAVAAGVGLLVVVVTTAVLQVRRSPEGPGAA